MSAVTKIKSLEVVLDAADQIRDLLEIKRLAEDHAWDLAPSAHATRYEHEIERFWASRDKLTSAIERYNDRWES